MLKLAVIWLKFAPSRLVGFFFSFSRKSQLHYCIFEPYSLCLIFLIVIDATIVSCKFHLTLSVSHNQHRV